MTTAYQIIHEPLPVHDGEPTRPGPVAAAFLTDGRRWRVLGAGPTATHLRAWASRRLRAAGDPLDLLAVATARVSPYATLQPVVTTSAAVEQVAAQLAALFPPPRRPVSRLPARPAVHAAFDGLALPRLATG